MRLSSYFRLIGSLIVIIYPIGCQTLSHQSGEDRHLHARRLLETGTRALGHSVNKVRQARSVQSETTGVSEQCIEDILLMQDNRDGKDTNAFSPQGSNWGAQMYDSHGQIQTGLIQGNLFWLGDFWECLRMQVWRNGTQIGEPDFTGRYCLTTTQIFLLPVISFKIGMCFPSTCTGEELNSLSQDSMVFPFITGFQNPFCQTLDHTPLDSLAVIAVIFFSFLIALMSVATIYELYLIIKRKKTKKSNKLDHGNTSETPVTLCSAGCSNAFGKELLLAFSVWRNIKSVFNTDRSANDLGVLHGLRAISMSWVVFGHTALLVYHPFPWRNQLYAAKFSQDFATQALSNAEFSVDSFFCMSGFLIGYLFLKEMKASNGKFNIFQYIFHRLWRLMPPYALVMLYMCSLYPEIGKGPLWPATDQDREVCREKWWQNLLFINVYFDETLKCLPQVWYLCMDIVFYLISPLILYPLHKKPLIGQLLFVIILVISFIVPAALVYKGDLPAFPAFNVDQKARDIFMHEVYDKPWCRITAYLVGIIYGYIFYLKGSNLKMSTKIVTFGWITAAAINLSLIYGTFPYSNGTKPMYTGMFVVFGSLTRPAWALGVGWVILACATGYGGYVNSILSWKGFRPLSKLSYSMYLVHFTVVAQYYATRPESTYIDYYIMIFIMICMFGASVMVGLLLTLAVESPFIQMEKLLSHRVSSHQAKAPAITRKYTALPLTHDSDSESVSVLITTTTTTNGNGAGQQARPNRRRFTDGHPTEDNGIA